MKDLNPLLTHLEEADDKISEYRFVSAFDGFIDQIIKVVDERTDLDHYRPVPTMMHLGELFQAASNRSSLREIVIEREEIGGCAVNLADGLTGLGARVDFFGTTGMPLNKAFSDFSKQCHSFTTLSCDPGLTMALEFDDGKYMLSSVSQLAALNRKLLEKEFADGKFLTSCESAGLIALTNWSLYPYMTECWEYLQDELFRRLTHRPVIYIDLVDPRSRSREDIRQMLSVLSGFQKYGNTIFGGNLNEGNILADLFGLEPVSEEGEDVARLASRIRETLGITAVALHCVKGSSFADAQGEYWADGPYCKNPVKSTGAGDRYNAGFCLASLLNLEAEERLQFANAVSGFFVRNGRSGSFKEVINLIKQWNRGEL
ncbi:MAG: PfkB family carbohydrate kinase [Spirochaetales bacterium]|nr:PfkB family carbohydrate kinase [Spirochaetales bacterium]